MKITRMLLFILPLAFLFVAGCAGGGGSFYQGPKDDANLEEQNQVQTEDLGTTGGSLTGPRIGTGGTTEESGVEGLTREEATGETGVLSGPMRSGVVSMAGRDIHPGGSTAIPTTWKQVAGGKIHTCAIAMDGSLWCWGHYNDSAAPTPAGPVMDKRGIAKVDSGRWISLAAGKFHTCAIKEDWTLWCFGDNSHNKLGIEGSYQGAPVQVGAGRYKMVAAGADHTCALKDNGTIACWGSNRYGQAGSSPMGSDILSPTPIYSSLNWRMLSAYGDLTFAASESGRLFAWGSEIDGPAPLNHYQPRMKYPAVYVAVGGTHYCYIEDFDDDNNIVCVGSNEFGQIGRADLTLTPAIVAGIVNNDYPWQSVAAGEEHTCAIDAGKQIYCWGHDDRKQLGIIGDYCGTTDMIQQTPCHIQPDKNWLLVTAGADHTCAITQENTLYCWGDNRYGQAGSSANNYVIYPDQIK